MKDTYKNITEQIDSLRNRIAQLFELERTRSINKQRRINLECKLASLLDSRDRIRNNF